MLHLLLTQSAGRNQIPARDIRLPRLFMDNPMSRLKDYHTPKRRDFDDDIAPEDRFGGRRLDGPKPSAPSGWQSADAVVKWFSPDKGFGFVTVDGRFDAFLNARLLAAKGYQSLPAGARLKVQIGRGQKGPQVSAVFEVDTGAAEVGSITGRLSHIRRSAHRQFDDTQVEECVGSVAWYNSEKGFGFIAPDGGDKDVFVHITMIERSGLSRLVEGQRVRMIIAKGDRGNEVVSIKLLDGTR
jgi:cold shock protein